LLYLPPGTTSHTQPLDAGIIRSFKWSYKKWLIEKNIRYIQSMIDIAPITAIQAVRLIYHCWECVSRETIVNCWKKSTLIPKNSIIVTTVTEDIPNANESLPALNCIRTTNEYLMMDDIFSDDPNIQYPNTLRQQIINGIRVRDCWEIDEDYVPSEEES